MSKQQRSTSASRFGKAMRAPFRMFRRARDLYIRGMTSCAGRVESYGTELGYPPMGSLPRSFSVQSSGMSSGEEDLRDLIHAASLKRSRSSTTSSPAAMAGPAPQPPVPRSHSAVVGRIDEDNPCDFGDVKPGTDLLSLPRSQSCAPSAKRKAGGGRIA